MTTHRVRKNRYSKAERQVAEDLGGRRTRLSGAADEKADVVVPARARITDGTIQETNPFGIRAEVKTTSTASYTLRSADWEKLVQAASKSGQVPVFVVEIGIGRVGAYCKYAIVPRDFARELLGAPQPEPEDISSRRSVTIDNRTGPVRQINLYTRSLLPRLGCVTALDYAKFLELLRHNMPKPTESI